MSTSSNAKLLNRLRLSVLEHLEVGLGEAANDRARVVADHHVHRYERCVRAKHGLRRLLRADTVGDEPCEDERCGKAAHDQKRNRNVSCSERIGRTDSTWPKVGELTTASTTA